MANWLGLQLASEYKENRHLFSNPELEARILPQLPTSHDNIMVGVEFLGSHEEKNFPGVSWKALLMM